MNRAAQTFAGCLLAATFCAANAAGAGGAKLGAPVQWHKVDGWDADNHAEAWRAWLRSCDAIGAKKRWRKVCNAARALPRPDDNAARAFFEKWFRAHRVYDARGATSGLVTGYYEPLVFGSFTRDEMYHYPLYAPPKSLVRANAGKFSRARMQNGKLIPFYTRAQIDSADAPLAGNELVWLTDRDAAFFLHVQGSGRIQLRDGKIISAAYAGHNGHPYRSIGKLLVQTGELTRADATLFGIRNWLRAHPQRAAQVLFHNPRYIFFALQDAPAESAKGALGVTLTARRSVAIDTAQLELGAPLWLSTNFPGAQQKPFQKLVLAQDAGGAIRGALRVDVFWGHGAQAERAAGVMRERGSLHALIPKTNQE